MQTSDEIEFALAYSKSKFHPSETEGYYSLEAITDAASKWAVIAWMWEQGFADEYNFSSIMENWKNYEDAYRKEKK